MSSCDLNKSDNSNRESTSQYSSHRDQEFKDIQPGLYNTPIVENNYNYWNQIPNPITPQRLTDYSKHSIYSQFQFYNQNLFNNQNYLNGYH